jgi:hypothetical protein
MTHQRLGNYEPRFQEMLRSALKQRRQRVWRTSLLGIEGRSEGNHDQIRGVSFILPILRQISWRFVQIVIRDYKVSINSECQKFARGVSAL